jgi:hypothetical protein
MEQFRGDDDCRKSAEEVYDRGRGDDLGEVIV